MKKILSFMAVAVFAMAFIAPTVGAVSDNAGGTNNNSSDVSQGNQSENAQSGKLDSDKLQVCQGKEQKIKNMFENTNQLGQGQLNLFENIANKVQNFYETNKTQLTVENYDSLVAEMTATRTAAQTAMQTATRLASEFGCDSDDPKGTVNEYKAQIQTQMQELKNYRTTIKNLVSAIKASVEADNASEEQ